MDIWRERYKRRTVRSHTVRVLKSKIKKKHPGTVIQQYIRKERGVAAHSMVGLVLVVEDEFLIRELIAQVLRAAGWAVL